MQRVNVVGLDKRFRKLEKSLERTAKSALNFLEKEGSIDVYLIGNVKMRKLNKKYRGKNFSTNVLAFEPPSGFPNTDTNPRPLGEIYICPPYIKLNGENINHMLIHGILHLLHFKHNNKSDRMKMENTEKEILKCLKHKF